MAISLLCQACGAEIGTASHEDAYQKHFHKLSQTGTPICPNCNEGDNPSGLSIGFFVMLLGAFIAGIVYVCVK